MPNWKYIDKLETYDDRHQAFKNELDNLLARCFGTNTYVEHKGNTVHITIYQRLTERDFKLNSYWIKRGETK